jgi:hypothetical protein
VLKRIRTTEGDLAASAIREHIPEPVFRAPWSPLRYLLEPAILPHAVVMFLLYSTMFSGLIILPNALAHAPYKLSEALIGGERPPPSSHHQLQPTPPQHKSVSPFTTPPLNPP